MNGVTPLRPEKPPTPFQERMTEKILSGLASAGIIAAGILIVGTSLLMLLWFANILFN